MQRVYVIGFFGIVGVAALACKLKVEESSVKARDIPAYYQVVCGSMQANNGDKSLNDNLEKDSGKIMSVSSPMTSPMRTDSLCVTVGYWK